MTKQALQAMAQRKYGKRTFVRENTRAATPKEKERAKERLAELAIEKTNLTKEQAAIPKTARRDLIAAARFVVDVAGDAPSIDQLAAALAVIERYDAIGDALSRIRTEQNRLWQIVGSIRWQVEEISNVVGIPMAFIHASADTLESLAEKIAAESTRSAPGRK